MIVLYKTDIYIINMALTNAERQARYKQRQLEKNKDKYASKRKEINKKYYNANKIIRNVPETEPFQEPEIDIKIEPKLKRRPTITFKDEIRDITINNYINSCKYFYKFYTNNELNNTQISEIKNLIKGDKYKHKIIIDTFNFIKTITVDTDFIKKHIHHISNLFYTIARTKRGFATFIKIVYPYIFQVKNIEKEKQINKQPDEYNINTISFDYDDVKKILDEYPFKKLSDKLIYALYMLFPVRRPNDYKIMKFANDVSNMDKKTNYYYDGRFYFNKTKTSGGKNANIIHQVEVYDVPLDIQNIINDIHKINNNEFIFGKQLSSNQVSTFIFKVFADIYNTNKINATELRRLYATYINKKALNYKQRKEIADKMNHSVDMNLRYAY